MDIFQVIWLLSVHHTAESSFAVWIIPRSQANKENLKGSSNEIFHPPFCFVFVLFFIIRTCLGHCPIGFKDFLDFFKDFPKLFKFFGVSYTAQTAESISPQYHTIILLGVMCLFQILFKRTVQRDFQPVFYTVIRVCLVHRVMGYNIFDLG